MTRNPPKPPESELSAALSLIDDALAALDKDGSVGLIAAHLDLTRSLLARHLGIEKAATDDEGLA